MMQIESACEGVHTTQADRMMRRQKKTNDFVCWLLLATKLNNDKTIIMQERTRAHTHSVIHL